MLTKKTEINSRTINTSFLSYLINVSINSWNTKKLKELKARRSKIPTMKRTKVSQGFI